MSHEYCKRKDGNIGCIDCVAYGADEEQSRIIKLLEDIDYLSDCCFQPNCCKTVGDLIALIKNPTRNITSEILPDGSIYIEEVKEEK